VTVLRLHLSNFLTKNTRFGGCFLFWHKTFKVTLNGVILTLSSHLTIYDTMVLMLYFALISAALSASAYLYALWHKVELLKRLSTPSNPIATFFSLVGSGGLSTLAFVFSITFFVFFLLAVIARWYTTHSIDPILIKVFCILVLIVLLSESYYLAVKARLNNQSITTTFIQTYIE
jgi:hypothetical protein